jgi:uncharacterized membrane protein
LNSELQSAFGMPAWDKPPFPWLQGALAFTSLVMTTLVLITQNRQSHQGQERDHLDLQVNLLTEQKVAKLIALVEELRRDLPMVRDRIDKEAESMKVPVNPHEVLSDLETTLKAATATREAAKSNPADESNATNDAGYSIPSSQR